MWADSVVKKTAQSKHFPNRRKFALSGRKTIKHDFRKFTHIFKIFFYKFVKK
jgi:hypothetical protein